MYSSNPVHIGSDWPWNLQITKHFSWRQPSIPNQYQSHGAESSLISSRASFDCLIWCYSKVSKTWLPDVWTIPMLAIRDIFVGRHFLKSIFTTGNNKYDEIKVCITLRPADVFKQSPRRRHICTAHLGSFHTFSSVTLTGLSKHAAWKGVEHHKPSKYLATLKYLNNNFPFVILTTIPNVQIWMI